MFLYIQFYILHTCTLAFADNKSHTILMVTGHSKSIITLTHVLQSNNKLFQWTIMIVSLGYKTQVQLSASVKWIPKRFCL